MHFGTDRPSTPHADRAGRVGLVLGGGGAVGAAYHAGALTALEQDLGWDARTASVVVGTSAGSLVGALLRRGVPASDLAALTVGAEALAASPELVSSLSARPTYPPLTIGTFLRVPRFPTPNMLFGLARHSLRHRSVPFGALSMLLPAGDQTLAPHLEFLGTSDWPEADLLVCAVRRRDWRRVVFGSRPRRPRLPDAVAASCAVPGYFAAVEIDGEAYLDGGAVSATNADVLARHEVDLAVVISPMTGNGNRFAPAQLVRDLCRRTLDRELRRLHRHGIETIVIEPGSEVLRHMSSDFMSEESSVAIMQNAFFDTGARIGATNAFDVLRSRAKATRKPLPA